MEQMIERQFFELNLECMISRMQDLQLQDKAVTLLNNLWDEVCDASIPRKTVESSWEQNGMEFTIGELKVPAFYFANEKKI